MQETPKPQPARVDSDKERLRQKLLRMIVKSEAQRRALPQVKNRIGD
jgi:hypothetical protein